MANAKISALPATATPASTDQFAVNQGGTTKRQTRAQVHVLQAGETLDARLGSFLAGSATFNGDIQVSKAVPGILLSATAAGAPVLTGDSNPATAAQTLLQVQGYWNGARVALQDFLSGGDTTAKDEGRIRWWTNAPGGGLTIRCIVDENGLWNFTNGVVRPPTSAAGSAGFRLTHGAAPDAPTNGDMWTTAAGLYVRINGATVGPLAA